MHPPSPKRKVPVGVYFTDRYIEIMMRNGKNLACVLSVLALGHPAWAIISDSSGSPYRGIVERNVFNVHPAPPPPVMDPEANRPPPPNLRLQGITDILGRKQVLFKVQLPAKPGMAAKEESFILTEGERQGEIEVLEINPKLGTVKVKNYGAITNLSLELNSDKLVNTAPVTAPPPMMAPPLPIPSAIPPPSSLPTLPAGKFPRTLRLPGAPGAQGNPGQSGAGNYGGYEGNQNQQQTTLLNPEQREIMIEAQRMKYEQDGNPIHKIFPPTSINPRANLAPSVDPTVQNP